MAIAPEILKYMWIKELEDAANQVVESIEELSLLIPQMEEHKLTEDESDLLIAKLIRMSRKLQHVYKGL